MDVDTVHNFKNRHLLSLELVALLIIILLSIFIRINFLKIPFERDEGFYTYFGKEVLNGAIPFKDFGGTRLSGVFYIYALMVSVFGYSVKAVHLGFLVVNILTIIVIYLVGKTLVNNLTGLVAASSFSLLSLNPKASGFTAQSEHLVVLFGFAGFLFFIHFFNKYKLIYLITSGLLFSVAFQIKQISLFYGLFAGLLILIRCLDIKPLPLKKCCFYLFIFCSSIIIPILISLWVIWEQGAFEEFKLWVFNIAPQYTSEVNFLHSIPALISSAIAVIKDYILLWILSLTGIGLILLSKEARFSKLFIIGHYIFCFITVIPGHHYFGHYFLLWIPAVALSIGVAISKLKTIVHRKVKSATLSTLIPVLIFLIAVGSNIYTLKEYYFKPDYRKTLRMVYAMNPFPESKVIADHLNSIMKQEDKIAVFGTVEYQMYVYLNKTSPTKYSFPETFLRCKVPQQKQWLNEFLSWMTISPPEYIVYFDDPTRWKINTEYSEYLTDWFKVFSEKKYKVIGYADIYEDRTNYVWDVAAIDKNSPQSKYKVLIYRRKENA